MRRSTTRKITGVLAGLALAALPACGASDEAAEDARPGDVGTVSDEEFLGHKLREVSSADAPSVELEVSEDSHGGWNLHLMTNGFEFAPDRLGEANAGEGHAHLYIDDVKYTRIYSEWFHLPKSAVDPGEHTLLVTLNANDHTVWVADEPVTAKATVTGVEDGAGHGHGDDKGGHAGDGQEPDQTIEIAISGGEAEPPLGREEVTHGDRVRIVVTSDQPDEVHLHGYDLEAAIGPNRDGVIEFAADQTGVFELETHDSGLVLAQLLIR